MAKHEHPPSKWELRPGDLPTTRARKREPLLRGLEQNAVFRLLTLRRRNRFPRLQGLGTLIPMLIFVVLFLRFPRLAVLLLVLYPIVWATFSRRGRRSLGGLNEADLREMATCPLSTADYVRALWGNCASATGLHRRVIGGAVLFETSLFFAFASGAVGVRLAALFLLFATAVYLAAQWVYPAERLRPVLKELTDQHRGLTPRLDPFRAFSSASIGCVGAIGIVCATATLASFLLVSAEDRNAFILRLFEGHLPAAQWAGVVGLSTLCGALVGGIIGWMMRERAAYDKERLYRAVEGILEPWRRGEPFEGKEK